MQEQSVRKQGWLKAGRYVKKDFGLESEIAAHVRESENQIRNDISRIEANQGKRLIDKVRSNISKEKHRKTA